MTPADLLPPDLAARAEALRATEAPFAVATVVRTAGATSAKPGARALLGADGAILGGWIGGGCIRRAVGEAARRALETGAPQLISVTPEEALETRGLAPGEVVEGVQFARNGCPSRGTVDLFVEPCLPLPELVLFGTSPVAEALAGLAPHFQWALMRPDGAPGPKLAGRRMAVVATQGQGDLAALTAALQAGAERIAFVGSARKFATLAEKLEAGGQDTAALNAVQAPAGLDIGAVTPEEIALSILAQLTAWRRREARA